MRLGDHVPRKNEHPHAGSHGQRPIESRALAEKPAAEFKGQQNDPDHGEPDRKPGREFLSPSNL